MDGICWRVGRGVCKSQVGEWDLNFENFGEGWLVVGPYGLELGKNSGSVALQILCLGPKRARHMACMGLRPHVA